MKTWLNPKVRVFVFLGLVNAAWIAIAMLTLDRPAWLWITPIALSINFLLLTYDQVLTFNKLEGKPLSGQDPWGLLKLVHETSERFQLPTPKTFLLEQPSVQVFSYGRSGRGARLFVTEGALRVLTPGELAAVLTYQMCVLNSSLGMLNYWVGALIDLFYRVGAGLERAFAFVFGWTPRLSAWFVAPWVWLLHRLLLSPRDFERLDRQAASRLDRPEDLARALWKMESYAQTRPWADAWVFSHMCMVSPLALRHVLPAIRIQPPLKRRILGLAGRYPL